MNSEIIIYQTQSGTIKIDVRLEDETVWLTQEQMAMLFGKGRSTVTEHISNVYEEGELEQTSTCRKFRQVRNEGTREVEREIDYYNSLAIKKSDVIIAKNYLTEDEIKLLGLLVEQYLAFAETMAQQRTPMYMTDWIQRLDVILQLNGRDLLTHAGNISYEMAVVKSEE